MALTKVGKEGITGIDNSSDATAITIDSSERVMIGTTTEGVAGADELTVGNTSAYYKHLLCNNWNSTSYYT